MASISLTRTAPHRTISGKTFYTRKAEHNEFAKHRATDYFFCSPPTSAPPDSKSKASSGLDGVDEEDEEEVIGYSHFNAVSAAMASTSPQVV